MRYLALFILASIPLNMWEDGRLTDQACWLGFAIVLVAVIHLWKVDRDLRTGRRAPESVPAWLRD